VLARKGVFMNLFLNEFLNSFRKDNQIDISDFDSKIIFANTDQEIQYRLLESERGCSLSQHRLGLLILHHKKNIDSLFEAYKWLFISVALGNEKARDDLIQVNALLGGDEEIDTGFDLVVNWFEEKYDQYSETKDDKWTPELLKWRFSSACVH
jgi:hypothetical protein